MKIDGKEIDKSPNSELIVIPRGGREPVVMTAQAVLDFDEFDQLCPKPEAKYLTKKGGKKELDVEDKGYLAATRDYARKQTYYMFVKSLMLGTPSIEFNLIKLEVPDTWLMFEKEFRQSGFSPGEINYILNKIMDANTLNEAKIEAARASFTHSQAEQQ
jgi:hypothetical protein